MTAELTPRIPDPETRARHHETLSHIAGQLRQINEQLQANIDDLEHKYRQSPIGQYRDRYLLRSHPPESLPGQSKQ
ncbi:hypothetical protein [Gloeobacter violaceus]|uniref:hypothetical protein n=1 Tax=Gloeobacter violaceus TaxID=33072 RepID=UPI0013E8AF75|nr:hypothetical protein [Gloeobacter violaceus]